MRVIPTELKGVMIIEPEVFGDHRGFFMETYNRERYEKNHLMVDLVQDNLSYSTKGILRGLHYQLTHPQAKLVQVLKGEVFDVAVDIRLGSPQFGQWFGIRLSGENKRQLFIPEGFAHGFCVTSDDVFFHYKCSDYYHPEDEWGITWSDSSLNIPWPCTEPVLSKKDQNYKDLKDTPSKNLPLYIA